MIYGPGISIRELLRLSNVTLSSRLVRVVSDLRARLFVPRSVGPWQLALQGADWRVSTSDTYVFPGRIGGRQVVKIKSHQEKAVSLSGGVSSDPGGFKPRPTRFAYEGNRAADRSCSDACRRSARLRLPGVRYPLSALRFCLVRDGMVVVDSPTRFVKQVYQRQARDHWAARKVMGACARAADGVASGTLDPSPYTRISVPRVLRTWHSGKFLFALRSAFRIRQCVGGSWSSMTHYNALAHRVAVAGVPALGVPPFSLACPLCREGRGDYKQFVLVCEGCPELVSLRRELRLFCDSLIRGALSVGSSADLVRAGLGRYPALRARVSSLTTDGPWLTEFPALALLGWGVPSSEDPGLDAPSTSDGVWSMFHRGVVPSMLCAISRDEPAAFARTLSVAMISFLVIMRRIVVTRLSDMIADFGSALEVAAGNAVAPPSASAPSGPSTVAVKCSGDRCAARFSLLGVLPSRVLPPASVCHNCFVMDRKLVAKELFIRYVPFSELRLSRWVWFTDVVRPLEAVRAVARQLGVTCDRRRLGEALSLAGLPWLSSAGVVVMPVSPAVWSLRCSCGASSGDSWCVVCGAWSWSPPGSVVGALAVCSVCSGAGASVVCWRCRVAFHVDCVPPSWAFVFPPGFWLCCSCLVVSSREFLSLDLQGGFSKWRLARREKLLEDQLLFSCDYVGLPASSSQVSVPDAISSRVDVGVGAPGDVGSGPVVASKRRRIARLAQPAKPEVSLAPPLLSDGFFRAACSRLGAHCPWVWEQTVGSVVAVGARFPGVPVDWDHLFRALLSRFAFLPEAVSVDVLMFVGSFLHRVRDFGLKGTPLRAPAVLLGPIPSAGSGSDMVESDSSASTSVAGLDGC